MRRSFCVLASLLHEPKAVKVGGKMKINNFKEWKFKEPPVYAELPIDENPEYNVPVAVKNAVFSKVPTEPLIGQLHLVCASDACLEDILDLDPIVAESEEFVDFIAGKYLPSGGLPVSHRYGGYQFGYWADQLGDGRAHTLGEYINSKGESWQPQLKGSGETPYSRFGDGRAVLRSSIREMLASEACHFLGIPTTRAAALVVSEEHKVWRDKTYSGRAKQENAAIVMRVAPCWYRLGSVEILLKRQEPHTMKTLVDHIIKHYFPNINVEDEDKYVKWYSDVAHRNLDMVATWQGYGFTHGVLNTDNVSVLGVTIDYGPYGFMEHYNSHYVPNSSDDMGRYAFSKQPEILLWNLDKFAEALQPILSDDQKAKIEGVNKALEKYVTDKVLQTYISKLGLTTIQDGDSLLIDDLLNMMERTMADFTATFRQLAEVQANQLSDKTILEEKWSLNKLQEATGWADWVKRYQGRLQGDQVTEQDRVSRMCKLNPVYVPRNWILQEAINDAENSDFEKVRFLLKLFHKPFEVNDEAERRGYSSQPPSWSYGLKLSCSS
ncbi:protein adenylyltransferase SelO-like [Plodia interpunctella]|uniref:protein adenylyltransferase SelO-like n=1 Tax=Plodia interpunctella TaxID=58824 RepID=UPI0023686832|nr:protein adenylyltransferase SelO-like [Plodia interpunctella]